MQCYGDCIFCVPVLKICKLMEVQCGGRQDLRYARTSLSKHFVIMGGVVEAL